MDHLLLEWVCNKDWIILNTEDYFLHAPHTIANLLLFFIWFTDLISLLQRKQGASIYEGTVRAFGRGCIEFQKAFYKKVARHNLVL